LAQKTGKTKPKSYKRPKKYLEEGKGISIMLQPLRGYELLSLKCNNPSIGTAISTEQLPVLLEMSGSAHHPVGVIASSKVASHNVYEVDYCSLIA